MWYTDENALNGESRWWSISWYCKSVIRDQTSNIADLGLHSPEDGEPIVNIGGTIFHSDDIRYAIFDGKVYGNKIILKNLYLVSGQDFTKYFPLFGGKKKNAKIQLPLPYNFFDN